MSCPSIGLRIRLQPELYVNESPVRVLKLYGHMFKASAELPILLTTKERDASMLIFYSFYQSEGNSGKSLKS